MLGHDVDIVAVSDAGEHLRSSAVSQTLHAHESGFGASRFLERKSKAKEDSFRATSSEKDVTSAFPPSKSIKSKFIY